MARTERQYRLRPLANDDLEEIWLYTRQNWSRDQADKYVLEILSVLEDLASGRKEGRTVDIRDGYFKHPTGSQFVFYRATREYIDVVRILHRRMDTERHL